MKRVVPQWPAAWWACSLKELLADTNQPSKAPAGIPEDCPLERQHSTRNREQAWSRRDS